MKKRLLTLPWTLLLALLFMTACGGGGSGDGTGSGGGIGVSIAESGGSTDVTEGGGSDSYEVVLAGIPSADVTITVLPDGQTDLGSGAGNAITLLFSTANWNVPQTVVVSAFDDATVEGSHTSIIRHTATSGDSRYHGIVISDVTVRITDNDSGGGACRDADVVNDIPFHYSLGSDHIAIITSGGVLKTHIGPWGAHTQPHTGHEDGDAKANWSGFYATRHDELTELEGDGDGVCERGETCGMTAGEIDSRIAEYVAPDNNLKIWSVRAEGVSSGGDTYLGNLQWRIESSLCTYSYAFGHVARIAKDLRDRMVAAGYTDPWTVTGITGNLITGDPIFLRKGESIGVPHVLAREVPGHAGYYRGGGSFLQTPWAQIEFIGHHTYIEPFYAWLPASVQTALRNILYADAGNPSSFRYDQPHVTDWQWKAEMDLWTAEYANNDDFSTIHSRLGSWWEMNPGCVPGNPLCDEVFSIFPIIKTSPFYNSALYDSSGVSYLVHHWQADNVLGPGYRKHWEWGEVIEPASPDLVAGSVKIKWRVDNFVPGTNYQAASYRVFPGSKLLKIRWSGRSSDRTLVSAPPVPTETDVCDGEVLTCHSSGWWPW